MKIRPFIKSVALVLVTSMIAVSCYTVQPMGKKKRKIPQSTATSQRLHATIFDFVQEAMYAYPHLATQMGMHVYELPSGGIIRLDRELPNFSEDLVDARVDALTGYLERLDKKVPPKLLSANDRADRRVLVNTIKLELDRLRTRKVHTSNPLVHVSALADAIYYPLVLEYAPENERVADILGRMNWIPSYVDRAIRLLEKSSDAYNEPAARMNAWIIELIEKELPARIKGDEALSTSYAGMKGPVLDSLGKFQKFLEKDLGKKGKRTWRLGDDSYNRIFKLVFHKDITPSEIVKLADERIDVLRREMYTLAKPIYCEDNETDTRVCGPSRASIAAGIKAQELKERKAEEKADREAEKERKAQERKAREEERKAKAQEAKEQRAQEKADREAERERKAEERREKAEERKEKAEERKAKAQEERERKADEKAEREAEKKSKAKEKEEEKADKDEKDKDKPTNPYADPKPKKKEKKKEGGISNPYSMGEIRVPTTIGAKSADDEKDAKKADKKVAKKAKKAKKADKKVAKKDKKKAEEETEEKAEEETEDKAEEKADEKADEKDKDKADEKERGITTADANDATINKVVGYVMGVIARPKPSTRITRSLEGQLSDVAKRAVDLGILVSTDPSGLSVGPMPGSQSASGRLFSLFRAPVFQPEQGARLYVTTDKDTVSFADLSRPWIRFTAARYGSPGKHEVYGRATQIKNQTRRAMRVIYADLAYVEGWALGAAILLSSGDEGDDPWKHRMVAMNAEIIAAVDLLADVGLHSDGMKEKEAVSLFKKRAFMDDREAVNRVQIIKLNPTLLAAAFIGLDGWRSVEKALKEKFEDDYDGAKAAEKALNMGPVPLNMLKSLLMKGDPDEPPPQNAAQENEKKKKTVFIFQTL